MKLKILLLLHVFFFLLFSGDANGAFISRYATHPGNFKIRYALWQDSEPQPKPKIDKTIIVCPGRASFIEKNESLARELSKMGFKVFVLDWRGQGGSDRIINHPQKVYVESFEDYEKDIDLVRKSIRSEIEGPLYIWGSSMGGAIVQGYIQKNIKNEDGPAIHAAIFVAPMMNMVTKPFPQFLARFIAWAKTNTGSASSYCYGFGNYDPARDVFEKNKQTHDRTFFDRQREIVLKHPEYVTGGPTFGWLHGAYVYLEQIRKCENLKKASIPIFIATAGEDRFVDNDVLPSIINCLPRVVSKNYPGSYHNISNESPPLREAFFEDVGEFVKETQG